MNSIRSYVSSRFSRFKGLLLRGSAPPPTPSLDSAAAKSTAASAKSTTAALKNLSLIGSTWKHVWTGTYYLLEIFKRKRETPVLTEPAPPEPVLPDQTVHAPVLTDVPVDDPPVLPDVPVDDATPVVTDVPVDDATPVVPDVPVDADMVKSAEGSGYSDKSDYDDTTSDDDEYESSDFD